MSAALAAVTGRGELAALVDPLDAFDPESAASCGVALERLLWIRGEGMATGPLPLQAKGQSDRVMDRAVKALNLVLQAGGFDLVVFDCAEMPPTPSAGCRSPPGSGCSASSRGAARSACSSAPRRSRARPPA